MSETSRSALALGAQLGDLAVLVDRNDGIGVDSCTVGEILAVTCLTQRATMGRRREESHEIIAVAAIYEHRRKGCVVDGDVRAAAHGVMNVPASAGRIFERELLFASGAENRNVGPSPKCRA